LEKARGPVGRRIVETWYSDGQTIVKIKIIIKINLKYC